MITKLKLKGIDGRTPPRVEPAELFDLSQRNSSGPNMVRIAILRALFLILWVVL